MSEEERGRMSDPNLLDKGNSKSRDMITETGKDAEPITTHSLVRYAKAYRSRSAASSRTTSRRHLRGNIPRYPDRCSASASFSFLFLYQRHHAAPYHCKIGTAQDGAERECREILRNQRTQTSRGRTYHRCVAQTRKSAYELKNC